MKNSHIEWTDHTFNPWEGCTKVSPGCAHCYAEARNQRFAAGANWGPGAPRRRTSADNWKEPVRWNTTAARDVAQWDDKSLHQRPRVFCASLADWLDDEVPIEWLADLLDLIRRTPNLDWLLLTKRPELWRVRIEAACEFAGANIEQTSWRDTFVWLSWWARGRAPANIWIGTTVEDQLRANERIPVLLSIPAKVRFLSCEPLLGPVEISAHRPRISKTFDSPLLLPDWVICGGESGKNARPMHPDWARSLRDQCAAAGVSFFFKQWGEWYPAVNVGGCLEARFPVGTNPDSVPDKPQFHSFADEQPMIRIGKKPAGRLLDGKEDSAFPEGKS